MGARPKNAFVALALTETDGEFVLDFFRGMKELAMQFDVSDKRGILCNPRPFGGKRYRAGEVLGKGALRSGVVRRRPLYHGSQRFRSRLIAAAGKLYCPEDGAKQPCRLISGPRGLGSFVAGKERRGQAAIDLPTDLEGYSGDYGCSGCGARFLRGRFLYTRRR